MHRFLLDENPLTGEKCYFEFDDHTDDVVLRHEQDVSGLLEYSHARQVDDDYTRKGMKNDMWHYAKVPNIVYMDMLQRFGVDMFNPNHRKRFFELLNTEYPHCKTTTKTHVPAR